MACDYGRHIVLSHTPPPSFQTGQGNGLLASALLDCLYTGLLEKGAKRRAQNDGKMKKLGQLSLHNVLPLSSMNVLLQL